MAWPLGTKLERVWNPETNRLELHAVSSVEELHLPVSMDVSYLKHVQDDTERVVRMITRGRLGEDGT